VVEIVSAQLLCEQDSSACGIGMTRTMNDKNTSDAILKSCHSNAAGGGIWNAMALKKRCHWHQNTVIRPRFCPIGLAASKNPEN